jgi:hypothetical protein
LSSYSTTTTVTYTVSDVNKVFDAFSADYDMIAQATGLETSTDVARTVADVRRLAQNDYLKQVTLCLSDARGVIIRAAKYEVSKDASSWKSSRPGNNLWPRTAGGTLNVILHYSTAWLALSPERKAAFQTTLHIAWVPSTTDTSFPTLSGSPDRQYSSNAYGLKKTVYE